MKRYSPDFFMLHMDQRDDGAFVTYADAIADKEAAVAYYAAKIDEWIRECDSLRTQLAQAEKNRQLHAGDTLSLSNELDAWKQRAQEAEAQLAQARAERDKDAVAEGRWKVSATFPNRQEAVDFIDDNETEEEFTLEPALPAAVNPQGVSDEAVRICRDAVSLFCGAARKYMATVAHLFKALPEGGCLAEGSPSNNSDVLNAFVALDHDGKRLTEMVTKLEKIDFATPATEPRTNFCAKHRKWPCAECGTAHYEGCQCPVCEPRKEGR